MRLKYVFIKEYKNLKNFQITFDGNSFIDVFVGKNGSGKSNFFEALIKIFHHLQDDEDTGFDYEIVYEIDGIDIKIEWKEAKRFISDKEQKTLGKTPFPDNVIVYYSGHNKQVSNLIKQYEASFSKKIKGASITDSRFFIGVGSEYKNILLTLLLIQNSSNKASNHLKAKMKIKAISSSFNLILQRPVFADSRLKQLGFDYIDIADIKTHYWGADGITFNLLKQLEKCINIKDGFNHGDIYDKTNDKYNLPIDIELFQKEFEALGMIEKFRIFDNLKTLDMLKGITIDLELEGGTRIGIEEFSDGQFQSIYIYAVTEIFKELNCITLLDEPDAFLHPEWQFRFLEQVFDIADSQNSKNHILMSSHSASTITKTNESIISLFEFDNNKVNITKANKSDVIKSLSAGLISFTEGEAKLNIHHILKNTTGAVLFTEGITDEMILETAWKKLYPDEERKFDIQQAFDRIFLRNLFSRDEIQKNFPNRNMFALFDFDEAFDDWNGLKKLRDIVTDPFKGLTKQLNYQYHYASLLPVPNLENIRKQVLDTTNNPWGKGSESHLSIELLFYKDEFLGSWFAAKPVSCGGTLLEFIGDKVIFADEIISNLNQEDFLILKPFFEFIKSKC